MANENKAGKNDTVGLFLQAMVDREPGKRKVKPSKAALVDLAELDLGESSDDSDFNVDEAKLIDDDDISINSDPDALDDDDDDDDDDEDDEMDEEGGGESEEEGEVTYAGSEKNLTVTQLLEQAKKKQALEAEKGVERPKILVCSVCLGDYSDDLNEIVTCDGCSVSVHEGCYGISDSVSVSSTVSSCSTEPWFCDACKAGVVDPPCELCPNLGYTIFKETEMGRWVHLVCALYIPGVAFSEVDKLSFPTLFEMPYSKWGAKTCTLCQDERYSRTGVCIGCDAGMCRGYFHVTCAQREGLLSEVNHGEADQADPYYAHCKLHTDRELIRRRKRNWLALQLHMKQGEADKSGSSRETQDRIQRKLSRYRDKYLLNKNNRPTPWYPTQKMPRALSTSASLFRSLMHKTELMGLSTESQPLHSTSVGDIRRKWHIPPAFNVEFISYYLDRTNRLTDMKDRLDQLLTENSQLVQEETHLRIKCNRMESDCENLKSENDVLLNKALELHDLLKGLAGRPLPLPPVVAALHNPPSPPLPTRPLPKGSLRGPIITKAAAKMMTDQAPPVEMGTNSLTLNRCRVCQLTKEQHLLIECDTCGHYYHLSCLDPPLTRMPKKTKQMGWQCSDCCKSSDSDKAPEVDTAAPRRLRRNIKEPAKFSPSLASETKVSEGGEKNQTCGIVSSSVQSATVTQNTDDKLPVHLYHPGVASVAASQEGSAEAASISGKRRRSSDSKKVTPKKQKKSPGDMEQCSSEPIHVCTTADSTPVNKMSPTTTAARTKKGSLEFPGQDIIQTSQLETRSARGRKPQHELPAPSVPPHCTTSTAASTTTITSVVTRPTAVVTQALDAFPGKTRRTQGDSGQPPVVTPVTTSPSRQRRQPTETSEAPSRPQISSPTRSRRHQPEPNTETSTEPQQPPLVQPELEATQASGTQPAPPVENVEPNCRRRGTSSIQLDTSVESLPSVTSLHSPTSESFHSAEDDPSSPRKEKRHRDGSKKKKKDKDKEIDGVKKRKKHHHRDKHGLGEMASEIVTPMRIKIKPLPPRPLDEPGQAVSVAPSVSTTTQAQMVPSTSSTTTITTTTTTAITTTSANTTTTTATNSSATSSTTSATATTTVATTTALVAHSSYQTRTPPAGYPPLPPGYTLTQPMAPPSSASSITTSTATTTTTTTTTTTSYPVSTSSQASVSHANTFSSSGSSGSRRRSDPSDPQQFSKCDVCGETGGVTNTVSCDECNKAYHFNCLEPPLKKSPKRRGYSWFCEDCDNAT